MDVDRTAPVIAASDVEIAANPDAVWDVLTDFDRWPAWNPGVTSMSFRGNVAEGTEFRWKAGPGTITSTIRTVERPRLIAWTGKTLGITGVHVYRLEPRDGRTLVATEESFDGILARLAPRRMQKMLKKSLDAGLLHLKARVEERPTA
jgi:hypothetical protein